MKLFAGVGRSNATADYYLLNVPWTDDWWFLLNPHTDQTERAIRRRFSALQKLLTVMFQPGLWNLTADLSGLWFLFIYIYINIWSYIYIYIFNFIPSTPAINTEKLRSFLIQKVHWVTLKNCRPERREVQQEWEAVTWSFSLVFCSWFHSGGL